MSTTFVTQRIWPELTKAARSNRGQADVAVAFFGKGASRLLPLRQGSRLVVDASQGAVASGQTCPDDLLALSRRGVEVFSRPSLHAKVFVFGNTAFIGSANASNHSAGTLIEAVVRTNDPKVVRNAKAFIHEQCYNLLGPEALKRLARLYRPPKFPGGKSGKREHSSKPSVSSDAKVLLAQLMPEEWNDSDQAFHDRGLPLARKRRRHPRAFVLDSFAWDGACPYEEDDRVIAVERENNGATAWVYPPAHVLYLRGRGEGRKRRTFVYIEGPRRRRKSLKVVSQKLGRGARTLLLRNGRIQNIDFARSLLQLWN